MTDLPLSARAFHVVDCPTNAFDWPGSIFDMHLHGEVLIVNAGDTLLFLDASDPTRLREISRYEPRFGSVSRTKRFGTRLVAFSDDIFAQGVEVLDVEDAAAPRSLVAHALDEDAARSGALHRDASGRERLFVLTAQGLEAIDVFGDGSRTMLAELPAGSNEGYAPDVIIHGELVVTSRRHQGLHSLRRTPSGGYQHVKGITSGYFGDGLAWEEPGASLLMCNDGSAYRVELSVPEKAKRQKSAKVTGCHVGASWARVGNEAVFAGLNGRDQLCVMVLDLSDPAALRLVDKQTVKGFDARDVGSDDIQGVLWRGDTCSSRAACDGSTCSRDACAEAGQRDEDDDARQGHGGRG